MTMFEFDSVSVSYDTTPILHDVSLEVGRGDVVGIVGRNGVGKTTLMKTAIGILSPAEGAIRYRGDDITALSADKRANQGIGYVPQGRDVFPEMTVKENLHVGKQINLASDTDYTDEVYEYFPRLKERTSQKAGTLSGGEQQMLAIGRALIGGPDLLLLDEPSEGIQPSIIQEISDIIADISTELDMTILFSEQHLEFTQTTSDYCYVMEKGAVVEHIPAEELSKSETVREYLTV